LVGIAAAALAQAPEALAETDCGLETTFKRGVGA
jgi:hypothetical protein